MKKAVVTGANGFVGSALLKLLSEKGVKVIAVVRNEASVVEHIRNLPNVSLCFCDMDHITDLVRLVLDRDFDVFFHFAWEGTAGPERANINLQLDNIRRTCDAVAVAKGLGCSKFVNACSIMQYEAAKYVPQDNSSPGMGSIYSEAKQAADLMAKTLSVKLGLNYNGVIISNIYGPYEKSERFLNTVLRKLLKDEEVNLTECTQLYDFIFIDDAIEAIYRVADSKNIVNESVYIGNEKQTPLNEFVLTMYEITQSKSALNFGAIPYHGVPLSYNEFDTGKLKRKLDFIPKTSFGDGVRITVDWLLNSVWGRNKEQDFSFIDTLFEGVHLITPFYREDSRGTFLKSFEKDIYYQRGGVISSIQEDFESYSEKNVVRGLHFQTRNPQIKIVRVIFGKVLDVIVDLRRNSPTLGQHFSILLSSENHYSLWIPAGFAHGFRVLSEDGALMSYKCIGKYEPGFDTGIIWNDRDLNIRWGIEDPILSDRDKALPTYEKFIEQYGGL